MNKKHTNDIDPIETKEWVEALESLNKNDGSRRAQFILEKLITKATDLNIDGNYIQNTDYVNSISINNQKPYAGNRDLERKIKSIIRWNAMAMVVKANTKNPGIGGHISSFASSATLYEVGFNHFFKGNNHKDGADIIFYQGHVAPGIYSRSFLENRFTTENLDNFRQEINS